MAAQGTVPYPNPTTQAQAQADVDYIASHPGPGLGGSLNELGTKLVPGLGTTESVVSALSNPQTWVRIGEGLVGVILIAVGISAALKGSGGGGGGAIRSAAKTIALPELQAAQASRRAGKVSTARQSSQTAGTAARANISVTTAGKKAYTSSYSREMGRRDARLTKIVPE